MIIKIYAGLSLTAAEIKSCLPDAIVCPPVRREDIAADAAAGVHVIGVVDGEFLQNLAVTPSEILRALRVGVKIYGSSSMGALRAAELAEFGMIGCGAIYQQIRSQPYFSDDHLGLVFSADGMNAGTDQSTNDRPEQASMTMIDFIATLQELTRSGALSSEIAKHLQACFERLHFSERNLARLAESIAETVPGPGAAAAPADELMQAWKQVRDHPVNQKRLDGLVLLQQIKHDLEQVQRINHLLNA